MANEQTEQKPSTLEKLSNLMYGGKTLGAVIIATVGLAYASASGWFGTRGTTTELNFKYQGKPGVVRHEDVRFGLDRYWAEISGSKVTGQYPIKILTDDNRVIEISNDPLFNGVVVREYAKGENFGPGDCMNNVTPKGNR